MVAVIVVGLVSAVLLTGGLMAVAFMDVALREPVLQPAVPLLRGTRLRNWAAAWADQTAARLLARRRTSETPLELARRVHVAASADTACSAGRRAAAGCPACCDAMRAITAPEALLAADCIRRTLSTAEREDITGRAQENARRSAGMDHRQYAAAEFVCPLVYTDGVCAIYESRPLRCRGWSSEDEPAGDAVADDTQAGRTRAHLVANGLEGGVLQALDRAGLDGTLYELNSALAVALENPRAAGQWARGEHIFANCRRYEYAAVNTGSREGAAQ